MDNIIALIVAILGSGGISALITNMLNARKYKAEARMIEEDADSKHQQTEREHDEYIHTQLREITETHRKESEELRRMNKELTARICELEIRINKMMEWIVIDNNSYRSWLETELRKYNPDIEFPKCKPAPGFEEYTSESDT